MTKGQRRALATLADRYIVGAESGDWPHVFGRSAPIGVEIGFGMGHALLDWAKRCPEQNLVGIEIYEPGIGALLAGIERRQLGNLRVLRGSAELLMESNFPPGSIAEIRIWFPDPWPKKRHRKRRLIQPAFAATLASRLASGGILRIATDWVPYADWIAQVLHGELQLQATDLAAERVETRFEARGRRLGHQIQEFAFQRKHRSGGIEAQLLMRKHSDFRVGEHGL